MQGLSAFLLGIIYEYNREPGDVTRATLHPILQSRVGPDVFANRILRLREDVRFKNVGPDVLEMLDDEDQDNEDGIWFDWPFVEFLKNNYRKSNAHPRALGSNADNAYCSICPALNLARSWRI